MNLIESFRVALNGLLANRMRSILTMLGIIIGVGAVISLVSFGQGVQNFVNQTFQSLGANQLFVFAVTPSGPNAKTIKARPLTLADAQAIANPRYVQGTVGVAPEYAVSATIAANGNSVDLAVSGTTPAWTIVREWGVQDGRFFDETDNTSSARVAVVGTTTVTKLFGAGSDALGQDIKINNIPFRVIGVLKTKGGMGDQDNTVVVPIMTALSRLDADSSRTASGEYKVSTVYIKARENSSSTVKSQVEQLLTDRHEVQYTGDEDFQVFSQETILSTANSVLGLLTVFLGLVAGISLLVGGIGVMNIMLVSVTERTREIGLRKAVGARYADLMLQFLIESVMLSVGGGFIGVMIGALVAFVASHLISSLSLSVTFPAILLATGVSTFIGIFFGLYPASRAAALSPIEALRYE